MLAYRQYGEKGTIHVKATVYGYDKFINSKFSYELENVVSAVEVLGLISIQYIDDKNKPSVAQYEKGNVKIVIEN